MKKEIKKSNKESLGKDPIGKDFRFNSANEPFGSIHEPKGSYLQPFGSGKDGVGSIFEPKGSYLQPFGSCIEPKGSYQEIIGKNEFDIDWKSTSLNSNHLG